MSEGLIPMMERLQGDLELVMSGRTLPIVEARMSYEKAAALLEIAKAYGWGKEPLGWQTEVVAKRKRALEALEAV